jgi:hypothetical protein
VVHVGRLYRRSLWRRFLSLLSAGAARAFFTRQYLVVGRKPAG